MFGKRNSLWQKVREFLVFYSAEIKFIDMNKKSNVNVEL